MINQTLASLLEQLESNGPAGRVARTLSGRGGRSLTQLAALTGYSKSTVSGVVTELRKAGLVVEADPNRKLRQLSPGRPETIVTLNPETGTSVGILIGLDHIQVVVVDVSHAILADETVSLEPDYSPETALGIAQGLIESIYAETNIDYAGCMGVGMAVAAPINPRDGRVLKAGGVPTWAGKDIRQIFESQLRRPVLCENESNCSAIAQMMWGVATELDDFVLITLDVGVGGAIVVGGKVLKGLAGSAGEFGHMTIDPSGPLCRCGNRGCLERFLADPLLNLMHDRKVPRSLARIVGDAHAGEPRAIKAVQDAARTAGRGLAILGTILNPPVFVIGGELALGGELVFGPLRDSFEAQTLVRAAEVGEASRTQFVAARFAQNEGCLGAAGLVLRHHGRLV